MQRVFESLSPGGAAESADSGLGCWCAERRAAVASSNDHMMMEDRHAAR